MATTSDFKPWLSVLVSKEQTGTHSLNWLSIRSCLSLTVELSGASVRIVKGCSYQSVHQGDGFYDVDKFTEQLVYRGSGRFIGEAGGSRFEAVVERVERDGSLASVEEYQTRYPLRRAKRVACSLQPVDGDRWQLAEWRPLDDGDQAADELQLAQTLHGGQPLLGTGAGLVVLHTGRPVGHFAGPEPVETIAPAQRPLAPDAWRHSADYVPAAPPPFADFKMTGYN